MYFKIILVTTLCVAAYCEETKVKGGPFFAVKVWNIPEGVSIPNCYKVRMVPVEVEKLHSKCACQDKGDWDLDVFAFSPKDDQPSLNRTVVTNVVRDSNKVREALKSNCRCNIFTSDAAVPVIQPFTIYKKQDYFVEYQLIQPPQMLGHMNMLREVKDLPIMRVLYCDHIPTAKKLETATTAIMLDDGGEDRGKLICDEVK